MNNVVNESSDKIAVIEEFSYIKRVVISDFKMQTEFQYQITFNEFDTWHYSIGVHTSFSSKEDI